MNDFESNHPDGCDCSWCHIPAEALVAKEKYDPCKGCTGNGIQVNVCMYCNNFNGMTQ